MVIVSKQQEPIWTNTIECGYREIPTSAPNYRGYETHS